MKESLSLFDKGLALSPPTDKLGEGYLIRARGMHSLSRGSFRTRIGSTFIAALNAHSIEYFNNIYHYGVGTILYRNLTSIKTALSGNRISFSKMPPVAGVVDYLFCAEGSDLFKVSSAGAVTDWGFAAPTSPTGAPAAGGALVAGVYKYQITYYNSTTGHRSNGNGVDVSVTTAGGNLTARLSAIPDPTAIDAQISHVEIWRTVTDGDALFYLTSVVAGITTFDDTGAITLSSEELPTDNLKPYATFFDCLGPHNASMFWLRNVSGERGYVYYSPIGRAESVQGFVKVCGNDSPLNKLFRFQGQLGAIGEGGIYIIGGDNPYTARQISGCLGTIKPYTVVVIPNFGMLYEASDGIRLFDGASSILVTPGLVDRIFRGESVGALTSFNGTYATFARDEYIITDASQSLAYNITEKRWRDLGVGFNALYYNDETGAIAATLSSSVVSFEAEGSVLDNGSAIPLSIEPRHISFADDKDRILQHITLDINCASQQITITLIHDSIETVIGITQGASRVNDTIPIGITGRVFGIRLTGSLSIAIELHRIDFYFNDPTNATLDQNA